MFKPLIICGTNKYFCRHLILSSWDANIIYNICILISSTIRNMSTTCITYENMHYQMICNWCLMYLLYLCILYICKLKLYTTINSSENWRLFNRHAIKELHIVASSQWLYNVVVATNLLDLFLSLLHAKSWIRKIPFFISFLLYK